MNDPFSPFWLVMWIWASSGGVAMHSIPMPSQEACDAARAVVKEKTIANAYCVPGETP